MTAILDEAGFKRRTPVFWHEPVGSFVVLVPGSAAAGAGEEMLYLGGGPMAALAWARRRRWEAREPQREAVHRRALDVLKGAIASLPTTVSALLPKVLGG